MKNNLIYLQQVEVEPPAIVQETLTEQLFDKLRMKPIPLRMYDGKDEWLGHCSLERYTEQNEVVVSSVYLKAERAFSETARKRDILDVYIHEVAHRLDKNSGHTATFLAINLLLRLRLDEEYLLHRVSLYDFNDEIYDPNAYGWAWTIANELHQTEFPIVKCVEIIHNRQKSYLDLLQETQDKLSRADRAVELSEQRIDGLKVRIKSIKKSNFEHLGYGMFFGALVLGTIQYFFL